MPDLNTVGVIGGEETYVPMDILSALGNSCRMTVRRARLHEIDHLAGLIVLGTGIESGAESALKERPSIRVIQSDIEATAAVLRFGVGPSSPVPFRGRSVVASSVVQGDSVEVPGEVIATADGKPVWTTISAAGLRHDTYWVSRPWIRRGECVFDHLNGDRFLNLLPLLEWLRWISDWHEWKQPPLQACFLFDDPNLHSVRYGFVKFDQLAAEGKRYHYHTSFATVPLDSYYVSNAAAQIIRDNCETLSLLIHGNNHTYRELAGHDASGVQLALMQQAILRTCRLEQKSGVAVSKVMAPPHGVCSASMMEAMVTTGFEAVCVSNGSVWTGNPGAEWTVSLGAFPAVVIRGLPVIPRFGLDRNPNNKILLATYLNQPVIPVGHHWDLADGPDILSSAASIINSLGSVTWTNLTAITRRNYRFRVQDSLMRVQTFSRIITVNVPEDVSELELEAPWLDPVGELIECRSSSNASHMPFRAAPSTGLRFSVTPGSCVDLEVIRTSNRVEQALAISKTPISIITRRLLVELRDRSMPCVPRSWIRR